MWGTDDVGWYYTPKFSYDLTGIYSKFGTGNPGTPNITVQIQTDRPVNGGVVLQQGTFSANSLTGGILGSDFSTAVALQAEHTYFVDFLNVSTMGVDLGQWGGSAGSHVATLGATTRLNALYITSDFSKAFVGEKADMLAEGFTPVSGIEPVLFFNGTPAAVTPEPSSIMMLIGTVAAAPLVARRYRRRRREQSVTLA